MRYKMTHTDARCPVCYATKSKLLYSVSSEEAAQHFVLKEVDIGRHESLSSHIKTLWGQETCDVISCDNCGYCFALPFIAGDDTFYSLAYRRSKYPIWKWEYQLTYNALQAVFEDTSTKNIKLLEIGAGNGAFVKKVSPLYIEKKNVFCTEYSEYGRNAIIDYGITCASKVITQISDESFHHHFDVICMFQILEHMANLDILFRQLSWLTAKTAHLFIAVPNPNMITFNELNNALLDMPPNHVGRWNKKCFEIIASRHGWQLVRHELEEAESYISKAKRFMKYQYLHKSQNKGSLANRAERIKSRQLQRIFRIGLILMYAVMSASKLFALRASLLGAAQWVHLIKSGN